MNASLNDFDSAINSRCVIMTQIKFYEMLFNLKDKKR